MKQRIYYAAVLAVEFVCAVIFHEYLNITAASAGAVILTVLSAFLAVYSERETYSPNMYNIHGLTDDERADLSLCFSRAFMICAPLYIPFVLFFGTFVKVLVPIAIFFAGIAGAGVYYRYKHGGELEARIQKEADELAAQEKREEMGKWK